ncbi:hypothetical protein BRD12_07175 [Halobacteriales archaeon SW_12_67_38]|nr:MAG: hypothetical protein BRD12_07175 [Halobacteriales archaeon SW_12_67_38]
MTKISDFRTTNAGRQARNHPATAPPPRPPRTATHRNRDRSPRVGIDPVSGYVAGPHTEFRSAIDGRWRRTSPTPHTGKY